MTDRRPYIYKITNFKSGHAYIGRHNGKQDSYFGSSVIIDVMIRAHGKQKVQKFLKKETIIQGDFNDTLLNELERHYIRLYNTKKPNGYNLTDGGEGFSGGEVSVEQRKFLSEKSKAKWQEPEYKSKMEVIHSSIEFKNKISKIHKGKKMPKEAVEKIAAMKRGKPNLALKGVKKSQEHIDKYKKAIDQYSIEGNFIKSWASISDAVNALDIYKTAISKSLYGKPTLRGGFYWRFKGQLLNKEDLPFDKRINQYENGVLVKVWNSIKEACDTLNIPPSTLVNRLSGRSLKNDWEYVDIRKRTERGYENKKEKQTFITRKIGQYDLNWNLIKEWDSIKNAAISLNIFHSSISGVLRKRRYCHTTGGFHWKYLDE